MVFLIKLQVLTIQTTIRSGAETPHVSYSTGHSEDRLESTS